MRELNSENSSLQLKVDVGIIIVSLNVQRDIYHSVSMALLTMHLCGSVSLCALLTMYPCGSVSLCGVC